MNELCKHCGADKAIRNPSGYCDHLYFPDRCEECTRIRDDELLKQFKASLNTAVVLKKLKEIHREVGLLIEVLEID